MQFQQTISYDESSRRIRRPIIGDRDYSADTFHQRIDRVITSARLARKMTDIFRLGISSIISPKCQIFGAPTL